MNNSLSLSIPEEELERKLLEENDAALMRNIVDLFNLNILKKNIIRINKLNNLQDKVYNLIEKRLEKYPDNFSNRDLLDYFKTFQETIDKTDTSSQNLNAPTIQLNQQNINIGGSELTIESRKKIANAVNSILNKYQNNEVKED